MAARIEAAVTPAKWHWPLLDFFRDLRVRYGIKLGLAAVLTLYAAEALRLEHPSWAILTVLVMMSSTYVGSIALKAIMRLLGTIGGALVGIWLAGNYTSTPVIFLTVLFLVMAFAGYKFGQFPASQVPYAYFLVGITTIAVVTYGVAAPDQVWQIGLNRAEEILLGAGVSLLVTTLVWPRYAREEFVTAGRDALQTVKTLFTTQAYTRQTSAQVDVKEIQQGFGAQLSALRNLLQAGSRESTVFSARLSHYNAMLVALINLFHAVLDVRRGKPQTFILDHLRPELELLENAILEDLSVLAAIHVPGETLPPSGLNEAFTVYENKVKEIRNLGILVAAPAETAITFASHFAGLRSVRDSLNAIREAIDGVPRVGRPMPEAKPHWDFLPTIDWFWVKTGVKGGFAAVCSILILKWINPPGATSIPLMAWTLCILGRPFLRAGGSGDLRVIQNSFFAAIALVLCVILLLPTTPFLADYTVMNLALFFIFFGYGFLTARIPGINFTMQITLIALSAFVGLNPQVPVPSQTIIDTFLGIITGMGIGAVIERLIWPVLPQRVLRDNLLAICAQTKALLGREPHREKIQTQLAILPVEALQAVRQIKLFGCSKEEKNKVTLLIRALQSAITRITELISRRDVLPEIGETMLRLQFERLEVEFKQMLDAFAERFREGDCRSDLPTVRGALVDLDQAFEQIRQSRILAGQNLQFALQILDIADQYHSIAEALEECARLCRSLDIHRYWGDFAL
jgi:uncharacterized membrane protein YccC